MTALFHYLVLAREDLSFQSRERWCNRRQYRIRVKSDPGDPGAIRIAKEIIHAEAVTAQAISFQYYFGTNRLDLGADITVDWCPNGVWRDADTVELGDESKHKFAIGRGQGEVDPPPMEVLP